MLILLETVLTVVIMPAAAVIGLLLVAGWRERARERRIALQVSVTDAIGAELGLVVAPVVRRRGRGWRVEVAMPLDAPALVGPVVALAHAAMRRAEPELATLEIVLTSPTPDVERATPLGDAADRSHGRVRGGEVIAWTGTTTSRAS
jgi:hypothetical protein